MSLPADSGPDFLGAGWAFPLAVDPDTGGFAVAAHDDRVAQAIWLVLSTAPGERAMRPDFGCGIHDLVFAVNDPGTAGRAAEAVRAALTRWEPRIDLLAVDAAPDPDRPEVLAIRIDYRVRATNNAFNLVYPFYLEATA